MKKLKNIRWLEAGFFCWFTIITLFIIYIREGFIDKGYFIILFNIYLINLFGLLLNDYTEKKGRIDIKTVRYIGGIILFIVLFNYFFSNVFFVLINISIFFLYILYSYPNIYAKSRPLFASLIHFFAAILFVLSPVYFYSVVDKTYIYISLYMSILFMAGHLNHETRDYEEDLLFGYKTIATMYGKKVSFVIGNVLFFFSYILAMFIFGRNIVPKAFLMGALFVHFIVFISMLKYLNKYRYLKYYNAFYRILFSLLIVLLFLIYFT